MNSRALFIENGKIHSNNLVHIRQYEQGYFSVTSISKKTWWKNAKLRLTHNSKSNRDL